MLISNYDFVDDSSYHYSNSYLNFAKNLPFYVESTGKCIQGDKFFCKRKGLFSYVILLGVSGTGILQYRDKTFEINPMDICFFDASEYQHYKTKEKTSWEHYWILMNGEGCSRYFNLLFENDFNVINLTDAQYGDIVNCIKIIEGLIISPAMYESIDISLELHKIISIISKNYIGGKRINKVYAWKEFELIATHIFTNLHKKIYIKDLAALSYLSPETLSRRFKAQTGKSINQYILEERLERAKHFLASSNYQIEYISFLIGMSNPGRFIEKFKKYTGFTPAQYRNKHKQ